MNIHELSPEEALLVESYPEYNLGIDFFYNQLMRLNLNIYYVEQISQFPFELFTAGQEEVTFFRTVVDNSIEVGLLIITRVAQDDSGTYTPAKAGNPTLLWFKNRLREIIKPEYRTLLDKRLLEASFDAASKALFKRAKLLQTERITHGAGDDISDVFPGNLAGFSELKLFRDELSALLAALSFNSKPLMLPAHYLLQPQPPAPDIEQLLDAVAKNSPLLDMPEKQPEGWLDYRERLSEEKWALLNHYRKKFGLPEVNKP